MKLNKGMSVKVLRKKLEVPYECIAALPYKGSYWLVDEQKIREMAGKIETPDSRRLFHASLLHTVPSGNYEVERKKKIVKLTQRG
jgi:hypothetical protein